MSVELEYARARATGHAVKFYADDAELIETVRRHVIAATRAGAAVIIIVTEAHRRAVEAELAAAGVDQAAAEHDGSLQLLDAVATLDLFMSDGVVDPDGFRRVIGGVLRRAAATGRPVVAFGEMVSVLWEAGAVPTALELEKLWNELATELEFFLLCAYRATVVGGEGHTNALADVCRLHTSVLGADWAAPLPAETACDFACDQTAPGMARRFVTDALQRWGHGRPIVDDARLVVSELTTNAVIHAGTSFRLIARPLTSGVHLSVHDLSPVTPGLRESVIGADSGHGLHLVAALAESWGVERAEPGKVVWAELRS